MHRDALLLTFEEVDQVDKLLILAGLAFCLWLVMSVLTRRLRVPKPAFVAATLSWIVALLVLWAAPMVLHTMSSWASW